MNTTPPAPIRVLLVDDSVLLRGGLRTLLGTATQAQRVQIVGEAGSVKEAIARVVELKPQVVLLDLGLPDGSGLDVCRVVQKQSPHSRIIVLTSSIDDNLIYEALTAGALGYLSKDVDPSLLLESIERVAQGQSALTPDITTRMLSAVRARAARPSPSFTRLSPQEKRVLELVVQGQTNKEIAEGLELSQSTVKNYLANIFEKLNVTRRSQAVALYLESQGTGTKPKRLL